MENGRRLGTDVHLEIESYYLFAKIVLDDVARAIEYYFGSAPRCALDSHDDLSKRLAAYAAKKGLIVSNELIAMVADLKRRISDVRDYQISHEKSPRTSRATSWDERGGIHMILGRLYPKNSDPEQSQTENLATLRTAIDEYLDAIVEFILTNEERTILRLENK
jgi:hypothetical protein